MDTTFDQLQQHALVAAGTAYAPYSHHPVGCAVSCTDGTVWTGANVENASYGLTLCAECAVVSQIGTRPGVQITRIVCVNRHGNPIAPCGRCRQLLSEFAAPDCTILLADGVHPFDALLPHAFGPSVLRNGQAPS
jgi:cytidine deaminase